MLKSGPGGEKDDILNCSETSKRLDESAPGTMIIGFNSDRDLFRVSVVPLELSLFRGENISVTVGLDFEFSNKCLMEGGIEELDMED